MSENDSLIFNTHQFVKKLIASGMTEAQAEAQMEIFIHFIDNKLATKLSLKEVEANLTRDLKELEVRLETKMKELEVSLESKMKELEINLKSEMRILEKEIVIKLGGMIVVGITVIAAMIRFF